MKAWRNSHFSTPVTDLRLGREAQRSGGAETESDVDTDHDDAGGKPHTFGRMAVLPTGERCRRNT